MIERILKQNHEHGIRLVERRLDYLPTQLVVQKHTEFTVTAHGGWLKLFKRRINISRWIDVKIYASESYIENEFYAGELWKALTKHKAS